uniref:ribosomal protein S8 n=1 Tax=Cryptomonas gyropyrenoidosa TaxID=233257 RepID=UPI00279C5FE8|nr:ribosomal protein S8 [Cryptomonas gyropyrenoidosa]WFQ82700.1 ribosomal protein S8 [Cryptomonas gyropyrenoidosa]
MNNNFLARSQHTIETNKYKNASYVKIKFSKKHASILSILTKEGFIRGFFTNTKGNNKFIYVLIKYTNNQNSFKIKCTPLSKNISYKVKNLKKESNGFNFSIFNTKKGFLSDLNCINLNLSGSHLVKLY